MDFLIGLIFWGGLLVLALSLLGRAGSSGRPTGGASPPRTGSWTSAVPPAATSPGQARPADLQELREDEALSDGLVIGHYLTRDHYEQRIAGLEEDIDELTAERDRWTEVAAAAGDSDVDLEYAEFDAMGGFGVEPWADEWFDEDDED